jgi:hypothetical protein
LRLLVPRILRARRWLALPGLTLASTPGNEYHVLIAFREDRPGGRLMEIIALRGSWRGGAGSYLCVSGWAGTARLAGLEELAETIRRTIPVDRVHAPASETVFLINSSRPPRPVLHPAECTETLLPYLRGWLNYLDKHGDLGVPGLRERIRRLGFSLDYEYT